MIPTVKQNGSWAQPVGSDNGSGKGGFLGRNNSARFSMDDLTAALYKNEEKAQKTDQILPFPLEQTEIFTTVINENIIELKTNLSQALISGLLKQSEKTVIRSAIDKLKKAEKYIKSVVFDIESMRA